MTGRSGSVRNIVLLAVALAGVLVLVFELAGPALASEPYAEGADARSDEPSVALASDRLNIPLSSTPGWTNNIWLWRSGRRAYTLSQTKEPDPGKNTSNTNTNETVVVSYDLDSLQQTGRTTLDRAFATQGMNGTTTNSQDDSQARHAAVDEISARLFIPYVQQFARVTDAHGNAVRATTDGGRCVVAENHGNPTPVCIVGLFVVDALSLDVVRRIPLGALSVDGGVLAAPELLAMSFSPGVEGESGKVYLYVREQDTKRTADAQGALNYVVQVDPDSGRVDWTVRADACRGNREPRNVSPPESAGLEEAKLFRRRMNEAVVFRGGPVGGRSVWVGCHLPSQTAVIVRIPLDRGGFPAGPVPYAPGDPTHLAGLVAEESPRALTPAEVARPSEAGAQQVFPGPKSTWEFRADPDSERILLRVVDGSPVAEVWWVFDGAKGAFVGTIGIGRYDPLQTTSGLDPSSGRLYVLAPRQSGTGGDAQGGLFIADVRRTPIPQALSFREFADMLNTGPPNGAYNHVPLEVDYGDGKPTSARRVFVRRGDLTGISAGQVTSQSGSQWSPYHYDVLVDRVALTADPELDLFTGRSLDLDEVEGATATSLDGAARGFAARALFVGGVDAVARANAFDATMVTEVVPDLAGPDMLPCSRTNRQVVLGFVGPRDAAVVDGNGSRGGAEPLIVDSGTRSDVELPVSRCAPEVRRGSETKDTVPSTGKLDWEKAWSVGLFSRPPLGEPSVPWQFGDGDTSCVSSDAEPSASFGDPVTGMFASHVECGAEEASGFGYARGVGVDGLNVSEAISKFRIYRDPGRGIVSRVESIARGIDIGGVVRIDTVRGVAESWANGRSQPVAADEREPGYNPNCDYERTAGTCFQRHIFGVRTPVYSCGPCGDEKALVDGLSKAMGANGRVRLRDPDETLRVGAPNGYIAAIQKPAHERFGDVVLNDDLLQTVVPVLEITRYTSPGFGGGKVTPRRRALQVYQFAGVEVSSSYGIQCLLVYDEANNTCSAELALPGSLTVSLADEAGKPLAGGGFEVRKDVDGDGVVGLVDTLLPDGACVTADDGIGTCQFENLQPGSYLVSQMVAPAGYSKITEPWVSEVSSGEARTVAFVNSSDTSKVVVSAADEDGKPLSGAAFAVFVDPDGDGKVAADAQPVATCTTDATGSCTMSMPTGSYVLVQTGAPGGLELIEPVAFVFASGGQTAAVGITNYPLESVGPIAPAAGPVYTAPTYTPPVETITGYTPRATVDTPRVSVPDVGSTVVKIIKAPGDVLRLLSRDPMAAAAWIVSLMLFAIALTTIQRRKQALQLMQ